MVTISAALMNMVFNMYFILVNNNAKAIITTNATKVTNTTTANITTIANDSHKHNNNNGEIVTKGCADGLGYYKGGPYTCFPIRDGELQTEPDENTAAYCAALGCPFNPPDI